MSYLTPAAAAVTLIEHVVSSPQLGFVPGRIITEASHLTKLMQAYLDETDEDGLMIALDWEKAFDSISWDYLHDSLEAINVGPDMRRWYHILYNYDDPLMRCVQANGKRTTPFPINSEAFHRDALLVLLLSYLLVKDSLDS